MLMKWNPKHRLFSRPKALRHQERGVRRIALSSTVSLPRVPRLPSWDPEEFQAKAYIPAVPFQFPSLGSHLPPACSKWFTHEDEPSSHSRGQTGFDNNDSRMTPRSSELNASFWAEYADTIVPLELTSTGKASGSSLEDETFHRTEAPFDILLAYLSAANSSNNLNPTQNQQQTHSIYLAQCSLMSLPPSLQQDIPTPELITRCGSIKGDIYASSLWLGRPPTYTPLHRDPNPNIFIQLAGRKVVRLLPPEVGGAVFADVQARLQQGEQNAASASSYSPTIRGEEMMSGPEKALLHAATWPAEPDETNSTSANSNNGGGDPAPSQDSPSRYTALLGTYAQEATLGMGDALFIPKGWWHSVKGVGPGITASANWWFR